VSRCDEVLPLEYLRCYLLQSKDEFATPAQRRLLSSSLSLTQGLSFFLLFSSVALTSQTTLTTFTSKHGRLAMQEVLTYTRCPVLPSVPCSRSCPNQHASARFSHHAKQSKAKLRTFLHGSGAWRGDARCNAVLLLAGITLSRPYAGVLSLLLACCAMS